MSDERIRLAFVGCGRHSTGTLLPNARLMREVELVAMCDLDEQKAQRAAKRYGAEHCYTDYHQMLEKEELDAVVVCGPPSMMQPIAKELLSTGMNVFMEKPPALTSSLCAELVEASKKSGAFCMVATHWRHGPAYSKARQLIHEGKLGEPNLCHGWFFAPGPVGPGWVDDAFMMFLLGQGVHLVDCTRSLLGDVEVVQAQARQTKGEFFSCSVLLKFTNGANGTLSMVARAPYWTGHRVFGSKGCFVEVQNCQDLICGVLPLWTGEGAFDYAQHSFQTWSHGPARQSYGGDGYLEELQHFAHSLLEGKQPVASIEDGYRALRVLEAVERSARSGEAVALKY